MLIIGENRLATNTVPPNVTGVAESGNVLSCTTGTWSRIGTFSYQWTRDGVDISGATSSTYTLQVADQGTDIVCVVTNSSGTGANANRLSNHISVSIAASAPIIADQPLNFGRASLSTAGGIHLTNTGDPITGSTTNTLTGTNSDHWSISADGEITPTSNFEASPQSSYTLTATVYNSVGSDTATLTIATAANEMSVRSMTELRDAVVWAIGNLGVSRTIKLRGAGTYTDGVTGTESGKFDDLTLTNKRFTASSTMRITADDQSNKPTIPDFRLYVRGSHYLTIDYLDFTGTSSFTDYFIRFDNGSFNCHDVVVENCTFTGPAVDLNGDYTAGFFGPSGVRAFSTYNIRVANNTFTNLNTASYINLNGDVDIIDNTYTGIYFDFCKLYAMDSPQSGTRTVDGNFMVNGFGDSGDVPAPHLDAMQIVSQSATSSTTNLTIKRNIACIGNTRSDDMQGLPFSQGNHAGIVIENNIVFTDSTHGCTLEKAEQATIRRNTIVRFSPSAPVGINTPQVKLGADGVNIGDHTIDRNALHGIAQQTALSSGTSNETNNIEVETSGVNSYENCFVGPDFDVTSKVAIIAALTPKSSGPLDLGAGDWIGALKGDGSFNTAP